jgi:T5orf172 domain
MLTDVVRPAAHTGAATPFLLSCNIDLLGSDADNEDVSNGDAIATSELRSAGGRTRDHRVFRGRSKHMTSSRRLRKKTADRALKAAYGHMFADDKSGAGYLIDKQLREYLLGYNDRLLGHGLMTLPSSFSVFEGFYEFWINEPANCFTIRPEKDHLFSLSEFMDFATNAEHHFDPIRSLLEIDDGVIYNFTPVGDLRDLAFLHAESSLFAAAGFTMIRHGEQLHWAMIGGPICDLVEETKKSRLKPARQNSRENKPGAMSYIDSDPNVEICAEPLVGTEDVWKAIVFGLFNLRTEKHEIRAIGKDFGSFYDVTMDDPDSFGVRNPDDLSQQQRDDLATIIARLEDDCLFFEVAETFFQLPAYFAFHRTRVRETRKDTAIAGMSSVERPRILNVSSEKRPLFRTIASVDVVDLGKPTVVRAYSPPRYKIEVDGFWRKIDSKSFGKDIFGTPVIGRTWVKAHLPWRDRPERPSTVFVRRSVASVRAKAASSAAINALAFVIRGELPPIFPIEIELENANAGWLYVMRCHLIDDTVFKIGWSSRNPKIMAEEISQATGVPLAYVVAESWKVDVGRQVEATAHEVLAEVRIDPRREFFKAPFERIRAGIMRALEMQSGIRPRGESEMMTAGSIGPVTRLRHPMRRGGADLGYVNSDLVFLAGIPVVVFAWEQRSLGEFPAVTATLDPVYLHKIRWPEAEYLYELPIEDPRHE